MAMENYPVLSESERQQRVTELENRIGIIDLNSIEITADDLYDEFCDPANPKTITLEDIKAATDRIRPHVQPTLCGLSRLSERLGFSVYFKKEFLLYTGSFKERGACNTLLTLPTEEKHRGVIAASAGNHALAVAYHGRKLGIPVVVVMPTIAPIMKINNCKSYGALVIVKGADLGESKQIGMKLAKLFGLRYINGYDHPQILSGQGTIGLEIMEQVPDVDAVIIPTGGGGLLAGIATAIKAMNPKVKIIAAESDRAPGFLESFKAGKPTRVTCQATLADGLAVPLVGGNAFATAAPLVDLAVTVNEEYIAVAILRLLEAEKAVVEGAGATAFAAVLEGVVPNLQGKKVVIPLCGGNIDTTVLGRVLERGLVAEKRMLKVWITISDRPGSLQELCKVFSSVGASVKDIYHERAWLRADMFSIQFQVVLEVRDAEHADQLIDVVKKSYDQVKFFHD